MNPEQPTLVFSMEANENTKMCELNVTLCLCFDIYYEHCTQVLHLPGMSTELIKLGMKTCKMWIFQIKCMRLFWVIWCDCTEDQRPICVFIVDDFVISCYILTIVKCNKLCLCFSNGLCATSLSVIVIVKETRCLTITAPSHEKVTQWQRW